MTNDFSGLTNQDFLNFLQNTELFKHLDEATLTKLLQEMEPLYIRSGEFLIKQGDEGDSLYVLVSGRLCVIKRMPDGTEMNVNEMGSGEIIGELALLTNAPRAATVQAIRDSVALKFAKTRFYHYIEHHPLETLSIIQQSILRLLKQSSSYKNTVKTIAICPAGDTSDFEELAKRFVNCLSSMATCLHLTSQNFAQLCNRNISGEDIEQPQNNGVITNWLNEQELKYNYVVYQMDKTLSPWTKRSLRQADLILVVANTQNPISIGEIEKYIYTKTEAQTRNIHLALLYPDAMVLPQNTAAWLNLRKIDFHHQVRRNSAEDLKRMVRIISGRSTALVLGGGGARGFGHIGVYKALKELGMSIDMIGGTSAGAMLGALIAKDLEVKEIYELIEKRLAHNTKLFDYTVPFVSIISAKGWVEALRFVYGDEVNIEDLWKPFFCISTNMTKRKMEIHKQGSLWKHVRASISLPAIVPPIATSNGDLLIDGAVINNMPVDVMRQNNYGGKIIAISVSGIPEMTSKISVEGWLSGWQLLRRRLNPFKKFADAIPNIAEIVFESITLCSMQHQQAMMNQADKAIELDLDKFGVLEFKKVDEIIEVGYRAAMEIFSKSDKL